MKVLIIIVFFLSTFSAMAMGPVGGSAFSSYGFNNPQQKRDVKYLNLGIKAYQKGSLKRALRHFAKSAKLGNNKSKYLTALVYLEQKEWVKSYAWLQLLNEPIDQSEILLDQFSSVLTEQEKVSVIELVGDLKKQYSYRKGQKTDNKYSTTVKASQ